MIPHLVTRIVYTGAGGWNSLSPDLEFLLSPRVVHLAHEVSGESTHDRGIFHTKNESLSGQGYHRMHLLCGESLDSETASWLKLGTTALVVAMIQAGLRPADGVVLQSPRDAMKTIASDPTCCAFVKAKNGKTLTAIDIQRHYLSLAEQHVRDPFMPPWAGDVCREWNEVLEKLEWGAPDSMETVLDWPLKLALFKQHAARSGFGWEEIARWNYIVRRLRKALDEKKMDPAIIPLEPDLLTAQDGPIPQEIQQLNPFLKRHGYQWNDLKRFFRLRGELFEIDLRFGQLNDKSIFASLDRRGVLNHHLAGVDKIEEALEKPPASGRAHIRGEVIRRLAGASPGSRCDWSRVFDASQGQVLDLSDPFAEEESWKPAPKREKRRVEDLRELVDTDRILGSRRLRRRMESMEGLPFLFEDT
jgi:hypothetical protein